ncbi:unnamed protein product [Rotaria magnacalcarata]|uniref:Uncharacterized protein n=1 Tax=Rotaria magnacalcarata TaxID=392030 RepID=A0A819U8U6_9BILA|nr:unnamed protein product [Rotaria magnacalcarata]CAF2089933.1 unnamed protein product [Rotaria magnacalcarata]CAF4044013.1 unnamed protein product [Rotaria magnacalcarata]CAF4090739.1 unnamed protein product [Rotaria magnacalcarata]
MNWTHRRPFRNQFICGVGMNKTSTNRQLTFREHFNVPKQISEKPIDAVRLQLADDENDNRTNPCPVHRQDEYNSHRIHPYIRTFSDHNSSLRRTHSSIHSISTIETDFVHQRVSTIHTYPSAPSVVERQQVIDEDNSDDPILIENEKTKTEINQPTNIPSLKERSNQCRTCLMLIEIVDQQAQQIRQYTEQISQQSDLLAKLARRFAGIEEEIDDQSSDNTTEQRSVHRPITN